MKEAPLPPDRKDFLLSELTIVHERIARLSAVMRGVEIVASGSAIAIIGYIMEASASSFKGILSPLPILLIVFSYLRAREISREQEINIEYVNKIEFEFCENGGFSVYWKRKTRIHGLLTPHRQAMWIVLATISLVGPLISFT